MVKVPQNRQSPQTWYPWDLFDSFIHERIKQYTKTVFQNNFSDNKHENYVKPTSISMFQQQKTTTLYCFRKEKKLKIQPKRLETHIKYTTISSRQNVGSSVPVNPHTPSQTNPECEANQIKEPYISQ